MAAKKIKTRFRAYQLGSEGSSFSYFYGEEFILIEGRLNDTNRPRLIQELKICGKEKIDTLHITSWDFDHCAPRELKEILLTYEPSKLQIPGYNPHTNSGVESLKMIELYKEGKLVEEDDG